MNVSASLNLPFFLLFSWHICTYKINLFIYTFWFWIETFIWRWKTPTTLCPVFFLDYQIFLCLHIWLELILNISTIMIVILLVYNSYTPREREMICNLLDTLSVIFVYLWSVEENSSSYLVPVVPLCATQSSMILFLTESVTKSNRQSCDQSNLRNSSNCCIMQFIMLCCWP